MIVRVCERAAAASTISRVVVATDDERIARAVADAGFEVVMTGSHHTTGTDRLAEAAEALDADLIANVQGDEPMISPATIDAAVTALARNPAAAISTTCEALESVADLDNPNIVKVVCRADGRALYFSRAPIPFDRDGSGDLSVCRKHTGLYVYRKSFLRRFAELPASPLELRERLEQLRALDAGFEILVVETASRSIGVDTEADLDRVRSVWRPVA
jgi:3-deoxy-manno-octulosonate cytidylyltransferase (CMP-KDO synthetase)